jgi:hypothetical protein
MQFRSAVAPINKPFDHGPLSMAILKRWVWLAVIGLLLLQAALISFALHRESLTFDETDHMYAGYRMWTAKDYGLNPEHPPLVKLLATLPVLGQRLWISQTLIPLYIRSSMISTSIIENVD